MRSLSNRLRVLQIPTLDHVDCIRAYGPRYNTQKSICAGFLNSEGDACQGKVDFFSVCREVC